MYEHKASPEKMDTCMCAVRAYAEARVGNIGYITPQATM